MSTATKHTPGPWHYHEQGDANFYAITHHHERRSNSFLTYLIPKATNIKTRIMMLFVP